MHLFNRLLAAGFLLFAAVGLQPAWAQLPPLPKGPGTPQNLKTPTPLVAPVAALPKAIANPVAPGNPEAMSDMTSTQQMQVQRAMDQKGKATETMSSVLKKNRDSNSRINDNLK